MKRLLLSLGVVAIGLGPAFAHHALTGYDRTTYRTVDGTVKTYEWRNPHARISLLVSSNGRVSEWDFEGGGINRLASSGFAKDSFATGDKITVAYNPNRNGSNGGFFLAITAPSGRTFGAERLRGYNSALQPGR